MTATVRRCVKNPGVGEAQRRTDFLVINTRALLRNQYPRVRSLQNMLICTDFMPEEGLEPPTRGL
jgi:hypothetical protein